MRKIIKGIGLLLFAGSFLLIIATAGTSDFGEIAFSQIINRSLIALAMMGSGLGMLRLLDN